VSDIAGSFLQLDTLFILALGLLAFIPDTTGCLLKTILLAL
jgi:Na+-transporting methylmalonyl-CoA/oxaloacetate decarboxylase beta subunit